MKATIIKIILKDFSKEELAEQASDENFDAVISEISTKIQELAPEIVVIEDALGIRKVMKVNRG